MADLKQLEAEAKAVLAQYDRKHAAVLPLLHLAQDHVGHITPESEAWVSEWTGVPIVHVHEVVTFYSMFRQKPAGKHHIRFCTTTSCVLGGSVEKLAYLKKKLNIQNGMSPDGKFSLEEVECLCACEKAPMLQMDDEYIGPLTQAGIDKLIEGAA